MNGVGVGAMGLRRWLRAMVAAAAAAAGLGTAAGGLSVAGAAIPGCDGVVWSGTTTVQDLWTAADSGMERSNITDLIDGITDPTNNFDPQWSSDGTRIVWSGSDGTTDQIWVADADGTNRVEISSRSSGSDPTGNAGP